MCPHRKPFPGLLVPTVFLMNRSDWLVKPVSHGKKNEGHRGSKCFPKKTWEKDYLINDRKNATHNSSPNSTPNLDPWPIDSNGLCTESPWQNIYIFDKQMDHNVTISQIYVVWLFRYFFPVSSTSMFYYRALQMLLLYSVHTTVFSPGWRWSRS